MCDLNPRHILKQQVLRPYKGYDPDISKKEFVTVISPLSLTSEREPLAWGPTNDQVNLAL
jgi:hypothetical protein